MSTRRFKSPCAIRMVVAILVASASAFAHPASALSSQSRQRAESSDKAARLSVDSRSRIRKAVATVGLIMVRNSGDNSAPRPRGSGVIVRSDGIVATNNHVITDRRSNAVYDEIFFTPGTDGVDARQSKIFRLTTLLSDKEYDLALLRIEADGAGGAASRPLFLPAIEMGDSKAARLLDEIVVIGFPEKGGTTVTLSEGIIEGKDLLANWIKTDARVIHGNSGGAAVNAEGKLIGIPTKVEADDQDIDKNGDGFPDAKRRYGAVGFLRPAHLVAAMLAQLENQAADLRGHTVIRKPIAPAAVSVKGVVRSSKSGKPIAGALVGLVPLGTVNVTEANLLTWGSSRTDGTYVLNKPVPPGRYTLKVKALGHAAYSRDIEINQDAADLVVEMSVAPAQ